MRTITVYMYAIHILGINVACDVITAIDDKTCFAAKCRFMRKYGAVQTGADY
jgi:hypothetical protein